MVGGAHPKCSTPAAGKRRELTKFRRLRRAVIPRAFIGQARIAPAVDRDPKKNLTSILVRFFLFIDVYKSIINGILIFVFTFQLF